MKHYPQTNTHPLNRLPSLWLCTMAFATSAILWGCSSGKTTIRYGSDQEEQWRQEEVRPLKNFFEGFILDLKQGDADKVYRSLSQNSLDWLEEMMELAAREPTRSLSQRPFYEILTALHLRVQGKSHPSILDNPQFAMQKVLIENATIRKNFTQHAFAGYRIDRNRGEVGLQKAPSVPVFFFAKQVTEQDNTTGWRLDLAQSIPILLLGAQKYAQQKRDTPLEQAIYILNNVVKTPITPTDLY